MAFDDSKFVAGDEVASIIVAPFTGDRGEIASAMKWAGRQVDLRVRPQADHAEQI